jgi:hypothetical protein
MTSELSEQHADTPVPHEATASDIVAARQMRVAQGAAAVAFVAGLRHTPAWKGSHMRSRRMNQLAPAMMSLAATNQQLLGLVGSRRSILWRALPLGIAAAGVAYLTADEDGRAAMLQQGQALAEQAGGLLTGSGVLDKLFK